MEDRINLYENFIKEINSQKEFFYGHFIENLHRADNYAIIIEKLTEIEKLYLMVIQETEKICH